MFSIRSTWTRRPSRMIATRSHVRSTSSMTCERQEDRAALGLRFTDYLEERLLDERIEPRCRLVEDQQVGPCWSATTRPTFCLLPFEYSLYCGSDRGPAARRARPRSAGSTPPRRFAKYSIVWRRSAGRTDRTRRAGSRPGGGSPPGPWSSRCRIPSPDPTSGGCGRAGRASSWSCRRRWGRGSRRSRPRSTSRSTSMIPRWMP